MANSHSANTTPATTYLYFIGESFCFPYKRTEEMFQDLASKGVDVKAMAAAVDDDGTAFIGQLLDESCVEVQRATPPNKVFITLAVIVEAFLPKSPTFLRVEELGMNSIIYTVFRLTGGGYSLRALKSFRADRELSQSETVFVAAQQLRAMRQLYEAKDPMDPNSRYFSLVVEPGRNRTLNNDGGPEAARTRMSPDGQPDRSRSTATDSREEPPSPFASRETAGQIHTRCSRAKALQDGDQLDISELGREAGFNCPVYLTKGVFERCVLLPRKKKDGNENGRIWDIVWMLRCQLNAASTGSSMIPFKVYVRKKLVSLCASPGPRDWDDPQPALTIMLPGDC